MMRVLIAPDKFKGSLSADAAARAIARGILRACPGTEVDLCPIADGGEGTIEALSASAGGVIRTRCVTGPTGSPVTARWAWLPAGLTAVIEIAEAAGLVRVPVAQRDPRKTTTYGVGELIRAALDVGAARIIVGLGGSATNDGGAGMAQALGAQFDGAASPLVGGDLESLRSVDLTNLDARLATTDFVVACDVDNPLFGAQGAAAVYGPQKGATPEIVASLDRGLRRLADCVKQIDPEAPGMGAAGGLGFGLQAFCGARLQRGIELVLDAVSFERRVVGVDWVITGEGCLDGQSIRGKACIGVAQAAAKKGVRTLALVGLAGPMIERTLEYGLSAYHAICDGGVSLEDAIAHADQHLENLAERVARNWPA